jgi:hypothetical protein
LVKRGQIDSFATKGSNGIFLNECRLLLRLVEDEQVMEDMLAMEERARGRWTSKELNEKTNAVLKDNLELCCSIIEETKDTVETMEEEMKKFNVLQEHKQTVRALP